MHELRKHKRLQLDVMHRAQELVREFHKSVGLSIGEEPAIRDSELRAALIEEEATETALAIRSGDLVGFILSG